MQLPARLGKYELQHFLGGGMSHVYRAVDTVIGRTVAVKILTDQAAQDSDARERFLDEARTAAKATHENVISIYDFGVDPEKGLFMVMEFLQGEDLRSAIRNNRTGDLRDRLKIALQAARALDFIHCNRIIHRDVKPENLHLSPVGVVKLMDFGIAKSEDLSRTQPGFALGTPYYMAPEQVRGEKLSCQADVYAYGVLLYELFTGQRPYVAETVDGIFYHILNTPVNAEPLVTAGVPKPVVDLILSCTAKNAAERPQGLAPVIAAIEDLLAVSPTPPQAVAVPQPEAPAKRTNPLLYAGIGVAVLVIAAIAYFALRPAPIAATKKDTLPATLETLTGSMVLVPAGEFQAGQKKKPTFLPAFYIDRTEVTNAAYQKFCQATGRPLPAGFAADHLDFPVVNVSITDAREFAAWAGKRLPSAVEWEKAARGTDGRSYPWGNQGDTSLANVGTGELRPADSYRSGASPYAGLQFVGNAWELVDQVRNPPANTATFQSLIPPLTPSDRWYMIRGESAREPLSPDAIWDSTAVPERWRDPFIGFRCARNAQ